ncbi:cytochrome c oxidase assembly protein COX11, mitochondrial isoform X2 [Ursus arctos]|uniref:cytochrome c oxidase assembly protein COX11, mitochondrial isoform X2 n=1 Tax=Ursus arctos TaxID=9644 RepID=UPI001CF8DD56|nr:cytochrome c oxidase assembly protein COX11, mitochondrial isoform X2 [Ursus arctos]
MGGLWRPACRRVTFYGWRWSHPGSPTRVAERVEPCLSTGRSGTGSAERGLRRLGTWRRPNPAPDLAVQPPRRPKSTNPFTRAQEDDWRRRNKTVLTYVAAAAVGMLGASYAAVPLYRLYCQVVPGETALAFYKAKNPTDKPVIGISTYNVVPFEAGQYFNKIQCFCFEEQRLNPQEEVDMPVFFYIDPEFAEDPRMVNVDLITLSYTFFEAKEGQQLPVPGYN